VDGHHKEQSEIDMGGLAMAVHMPQKPVDDGSDSFVDTFSTSLLF